MMKPIKLFLSQLSKKEMKENWPEFSNFEWEYLEKILTFLSECYNATTHLSNHSQPI